jgi:molecular chaperone DnaK
MLHLKRPIPTRAVRVRGIDLGTTNSSVAEITWDPQQDTAPKARCLDLEQPTLEGVHTSPLVPSVLAVRGDGSHWVGEGAKRLRVNPQQAKLQVGRTLFFENKNDMGTRRTYFGAGPEYDHASKIAGHILTFLNVEADRSSAGGAERTVVTVPASFQVNQRRDTLHAAQRAGLQLTDYDLLDEPTAALIAHLYGTPSTTTDELFSIDESKSVVVFDFGGGTCDVAVFDVRGTADDDSQSSLSIRPRAVSRYHRLGGGDLDAGVFHEVLLPALLEENNIEPHALSFSEKKLLESQLLATAEALKITLCKEIARLKKFDKYDEADKSALVARLPGVSLQSAKRQLTMARPSLSAEAWEGLLEPFLDVDSLYARQSDYRLTQSVFAPLEDALMRARLSQDDISFCLLVGGSSLIPQVQDAIIEYFPKAQVRTFSDQLSTQTAVAEGAALHAFSLAATGKPLIERVANDAIVLMTGDGDPYELIPAGVTLPYPPDGSYHKVDAFAVPAMFGNELKMEVAALPERYKIFEETWTLPEDVEEGDQIRIECRLDANGDLDLRATLPDRLDEPFVKRTSNPLVNVVNPSATRLLIEEAEEDLRIRGGGAAADRDTFVKIAKWYSELRQNERALEWLRVALHRLNAPDHEILNLRGIYCGQIGDYEGEQKAYREADAASRTGGAPMFNLALSLRRQRQYKEALEAVDRALVKEPHDGAYLTLRAMVLKDSGKKAEAKEEFKRGAEYFDGVTDATEWELGWILTSATNNEDTKLVKEVKEEQQLRVHKSGSDSDLEIEAPRPVLIKVAKD